MKSRYSLFVISTIVGSTFSTTFAKAEKKPLNVLLITADDLNYNSVGFMGCKVKNTTPNIDAFSHEGMRFNNAFVNISVSQPSRAVMATGLYSHNNGVEGFYHTNKNIKTIMDVLRENGYLVGIAGKYDHSTPVDAFKWDYAIDQPDLGEGRDPDLYYKAFTSFIKRAKEEGKPFYFMANSHDPHAPFHGSEREKKMFPKHNFPDASYVFSADEMVVPGFLIDSLEQTKIELAQYYSSVRRLDDTVGSILKVIKEQGLEKNTMIIFLSDNGMDFPFAKTNCYVFSNKTPLVVKYPGVTKENSIDNKHFIGSIDLMPTILDACNIKNKMNFDGRSFLPILKGKTQLGFKRVYTQFYETAGLKCYPMFAVQDENFSYIFNPWADGKRVFKNYSWEGLTFKKWSRLSSSNKKVKERLDFFKYRVKEEFYDLNKDPNAWNNLINAKKYQNKIEFYKRCLYNWMKKTNAWAAILYEHKDDAEFLEKYMMEMQKEAYIQHK